jgi:hypothetical protein
MKKSPILSLMKKFQALTVFFLFVIALMISGFVHARPTYEMCGARPGLFDRLLTDAEKIRIKCIEDVYAANQEAIRKEVAELQATSQKLSLELKKVAVKVNYNIVQCSPRTGEPARDPKLVSRCQELVKAQNQVISRIDELMGWSEKPRPKPTDNTTLSFKRKTRRHESGPHV